MTLANLLAIQRLLAFSATPAGVQRLLAAAARNLADAQIALRKQRNLNDYEGDPVSDGVVAECLTQAKTLLTHTRDYLQTQFPDLLPPP